MDRNQLELSLQRRHNVRRSQPVVIAIRCSRMELIVLDQSSNRSTLYCSISRQLTISSLSFMGLGPIPLSYFVSLLSRLEGRTLQ